MTFVARLALVGAVAAAAILAGCASTEGPTVTEAPGSPVVGVVTAIDAGGLSDVRGFTLRTADGRTLEFTIGVLENGAEFPPGHLGEHLTTTEPVRVFFRQEGASLVVYRLEDAPG